MLINTHTHNTHTNTHTHTHTHTTQQAEALAMSVDDPAFKNSTAGVPSSADEQKLEKLCDAAAKARAGVATALDKADVAAR
jgi:hypothetical protein